MANRYWVGGTATWDGTAGTKWATVSGGAGGAAVPTAADDVVMDAASGAVTVSTTASSIARSVDFTGFTGTWSSVGASTILQVGDASGGALKLSATMTVSLGITTTIVFQSTSNNGGSGWGITTAGKTLNGGCSITFNGAGGKWVLQDSLTATSGTITLTAGTLDTNNQSVTAGSLLSNVSNTRTLTLGSSTVTLTAAGTSFSFTLITGLTVTANTATVVMSGAGVTAVLPTNSTQFATTAFALTGSGLAFFTFGAGSTTQVGSFTRTGTASKTDSLQLSGGLVVNGNVTLGGASVQGVNRLLVQGNVPGIQKAFIPTGNIIITGDVDFMDMDITGSPTWTNSGNAYIGDALGNGTLITTNRTTPATQTHTASAGGNWSDVTKWNSRVPLPQDNVVVDVNTTGTLTADMPRLGKDIDFTGFIGTAAFNATAMTLFGSLTLSSGMTFTHSGFTLTAGGRGSHTWTSAGKAFVTLTFQGPGGTYTLQDALTTGTSALTINDGTFNTNNQSVTCSTFTAASGRATTLNLGTSTISLTSTGTVNVVSLSGATTLNAALATMVIATASSATRTFGLASKTLGTLSYTVAASTGILSVINSNTITTLNVGNGRNITFQSGTTTTVTNWNVNGVANGYLYLPGVSGHYASVPDSAALSITSDITVLARVAMDDWTPAATQDIATKFTTTGNQRSWAFTVGTDGKPKWFVSSDGTVQPVAISSAAPTIADGAVLWMLVSWRASDGRTQFFTANGSIANPAASDFTQLGTDQTVAAGTAIFDSTTPVEISSQQGGTSALGIGKFYRTMIYNGLFSTAAFGGTKQLDADFTTHNAGSSNWSNAAKTQFTESSSNAATVTINGSLAQVGDGRIALTSSTPGSAATLSSSGNQTSDYLTIQDSTAQGANWYAGLHSLDNGNNKGWIFNTLTPPSTNGNFTIFGGPN